MDGKPIIQRITDEVIITKDEKIEKLEEENADLRNELAVMTANAEKERLATERTAGGVEQDRRYSQCTSV